MANLLHKASIITTPTAYGVGVLNSIKPAFSVSDTELVTNGDFSNGLTGWTGSTPPTQNPDNSLTFDSPSENMFQSISRIVGRKYRITFDGTGSLRYRTGYASPDNAVRQVTLPAVVDIVANATTNRIQPYGPSSGTTILKSISLREITDADFDFTRTSSATRVNPDYLIETVSINSANLVQNGNFSELGSEIIVNGTFDTDSNWTKGTGTTISDGNANFVNATGVSLYQNIGTQTGTVKVEFTVTNYTSGTLNVYSGGNQSVGVVNVSANALGTYTAYVVRTGGNVNIIFGSSDSFTGSIDNVSVKQVDPNDNWRLFNGATITDNKANIIGDGSAFGYIEQLNTFTSGKKYKITLDAVINSGGGLVVKYALGFSANIGSITTSGSYTFSYTAGVTGSIIIGRKTGGTAYDSSITNISVIEIQENGVPRLDYTNGTASILLEPQSTNLLTYSNDFSNSDWTKQSGVTATYNTTETLSPDGTYNATKLIGNGTTGIFDSVTVSGVVSRSIYIKSVTGNVNVILKDPQNTVTEKTLNVTTQWQRFELVEDNTISSQGIWVDDIPSSGIYIYGAQIESQSYTTSYIPTDGSSVTRAAESLTNAANSDLINSTEGVLYAEMAALADDSTLKSVCINDSTTGNRVIINYSNQSNRLTADVRVGAVGQAFMQTFNFTITNFLKIALKYKANDFALWVNGTEVATDNSGSTFSANTLNNLSFDNGAGGEDFYGNTKTVAVFKEALSDTELACLTSTTDQEIFFNYYYRMQYVGADMSAIGCAERTYNI